jgi:hypothetical protein
MDYTRTELVQKQNEESTKKERERCLLILREPLSYNEMREAIINVEEGDYQINLDTHPPDPEELHIIDRLTMLVETMREEPAYELESNDFYKATLFWADQIEKTIKNER